MSLSINLCSKSVAACFQDIFGSKNGFQGQNNVQNGSKQSAVKKTGSSLKITLKIVSNPKIIYETGSCLEIMLKIVSSGSYF